MNDIGEDKLEGEEALNDFFKQIYGKGDPEVGSEIAMTTPKAKTGRGTTRTEDAQGTPTLGCISPSILGGAQQLLQADLRQGRPRGKDRVGVRPI